MANKYRNEMEIELGPNKILLRPTFSNIAETESNLGSVAYLAWKFSRSVRSRANNEIEKSVKELPPLTECAQIIYYNQAEKDPDDASKRKLSLDDIWQMLLDHGAGNNLTVKITIFIGMMLSGGKQIEEEELLDEKKS